MKKIRLITLFVLTALLIVSCNKENRKDDSINPFDNISESSNKERDKIVIISDLHLGNDLSYSETVKHLDRLEEFIIEVHSSKTVKELIMGGDIFDEWYIPTRTETYGGKSQADFIRKTVAANKGVFDALNKIIKEGKIKVTYVPGNHDMGFLPENINIALPGVNQARDAGQKYGIGTYNPDGYPQIAIEHGHRYDFFSSIAPNANESEAPGATLPPGYFFARIAANSFVNPTTPEAATKIHNVTLNHKGNPEQESKHIYYSIWAKVLTDIIYVKDNFNEPIIKTNVGNFTKTYSINDILPKNNPNDGNIEMNLYNGLFTQASWDARLSYNNVPVTTKINDAIIGSIASEFIDSQADLQYFNNTSSDTRIVVFGHTHAPKIKQYTNHKGKPSIYVNSGTWEDLKSRDKNAAIDQDSLKMHFVIIAPVNSDKNKLRVYLNQYRYGKHTTEGSLEITL